MPNPHYLQSFIIDTDDFEGKLTKFILENWPNVKRVNIKNKCSGPSLFEFESVKKLIEYENIIKFTPSDYIFELKIFNWEIEKTNSKAILLIRLANSSIDISSPLPTLIISDES